MRGRLTLVLLLITCGCSNPTSPNNPPVAQFDISPRTGTIETVFMFDASSSTDAEDDALDRLQVRWDWENDGVWDTAWSYGKIDSHQYSNAGLYTILLEVIDSHSAVDSTSVLLEVLPGTLVYSENFSDAVEGGMPAGWAIITQQAATQEGPADWKVVSGRLHQASNVQAPHTPGLSWALNYEGTMAIVGDISWVNISFISHVIPRDDDGIGVIFRWRPSAVHPDGNFYRLLMVEDSAADGPKLRLDKHVDGVWMIIKEKTNTYSGYDENCRYTIEVDMVVDDFTIKLDGAIIFEFEDKIADGGLPGGKIGFFCYAEEGADFDNISVCEISP